MSYGGTYGKLTLVATTAALVPTAPLREASGLAIQNLDTAEIYVGFDSSVTDSNGWFVPAKANGIPGTISLGLPKGGTPATVYAYSVAGTAANAVRYLQIL